MVIKLVKATATFQIVSLSGLVVVVTKPKNLIFSSRLPSPVGVPEHYWWHSSASIPAPYFVPKPL